MSANRNTEALFASPLAEHLGKADVICSLLHKIKV